jgi:hypothetical protein
MKLLFVIFLGMFVYGMVVGPYGAGAIALLAAVAICYCARRLAYNTRLHNADPHNAKSAPCTVAELDKYECECCRPN